MFESCWAHHSTRLHLAVGETKSRSRRVEGPTTSSFHFHSSADDGIVVRMWFVYMLRCSNGSLYVGETNDIAQRVADHELLIDSTADSETGMLGCFLASLSIST